MPFLYDGIATLYSDELARQATITILTGTARSTYGVDKLVDDNPAHLFRTTSTTVRLQFDHGGIKQALALLALIHPTTEEDDDVRLMADDDADWDDPAFDAEFPQAGWWGSGQGRWPKNPVIYPADLEGYDEAGYKYHLLAFGATTPLAQNLELGEIRMHPAVQRWPADRGFRDRWEKRQITHETAFGVQTIYPRRADTQRFSLAFSGLDDDEDERTELKSHWADVEGQAQTFVYVPDGLVNEAFLTQYDMSIQEFERQSRRQSVMQLQLREKSRGLRPGV